MNNLQPCILIVAPYSKRFGIAVFRDSELIYFAVKTFRTPRKTVSIKNEISIQLKALMREFMPTSILVKELAESQAGAQHQQHLTFAVKRAADAAEIPSREIPFDKVKKRLCTADRPTNENVFAAVQARYPELTRLTQSQDRWQNEYYTSLLSAVAIGLAYYER